MSVDTLLQILQQFSDSGDGELPVYIGIPYRNGIGLHYEGIKNINGHSGIVDIFTSVPDEDDMEKRHG